MANASIAEARHDMNELCENRVNLVNLVTEPCEGTL
jgi:hypothetical protein